ncbi:MAG: Na/Pi cotransporter family protein [Usitatibacteraceae bacterium]
MHTLINILSGVALLVWGTHIVRSGVLRVFGANLRRVLSESMANRFHAFLAGLGVTGLVQSSSATAVITASFVGQNLMPLAPALAIMLGADVGTSLVAQVFSFDLSWLAPVMIGVGVVLHLSRKGTRIGQIGRVGIGIGLILLALQMIMNAARPLSEAPGVRVILGSISGDPMLDMLVGAVFAVAFWSSLAVVLLTAAFTASGLIGLKMALFLVLGANLGSAILGLLATSGTGTAGRRVALGNICFKVIGCAITVALLGSIESLLTHIDPAPGRIVVNFHLAFNLLLAICLIGFTAPVARFVERFTPDQPSRNKEVRAKHLDAGALDTPALATSNAAREALRIGDTIETMLAAVLPVIQNKDAKLAAEVRRMDDDVDELYTAIKLYLTQISREALDEKESRRWTEIISLTINLEHIGDIIEHIVEDVASKLIAHRLTFSEAGMDELCQMHARLLSNLRLGLNVFLNGERKSAERLLSQKVEFREMALAFAESHLQRLGGQSLQTIETSSLHLDIINDFKRINSHICSIAYPILEQAGALSRSRLRASTDLGKTSLPPSGASTSADNP